jgi:hypothetical protein
MVAGAVVLGAAPIERLGDGEKRRNVDQVLARLPARRGGLDG